VNDRVITTDDGVPLHTRRDGDPDAPVLLLCNSLGTDLTMWEPQIETWATHRRVLRFDQRGHGRSGTPPAPYTIERLGRDALAVLDAYQVERADVCGLSLGGLVALWLAGSVPARVRRAVFADTAIRVGTEEAWRQRAATVRAEGMGAVTDLVLDRFFSPSFRAAGSPSVAAVERMLREASIDGYAGSCDALATADLSDLAVQVQAPSLVLVGTEDAATPPRDAVTLKHALPDAQYVELCGAGHLANLEQPQLFAQAVHTFLLETGPTLTRDTSEPDSSDR
jgi:3-oxoadipate enol-lactonase